MELEKHYVHRSGRLRAAVLGANDGLLSTASLVIGIAAASDTRSPVMLAAVAGIVAGAFSMAAGEYVSVSSQSDVEKADLSREKKELEGMPGIELQELAKIYSKRGLDEKLALEVASQLTAHDDLGAHARDELGINEITQARPMQAAFALELSFLAGGMLPLLVSLFALMKHMLAFQYSFAMFFWLVQEHWLPRQEARSPCSQCFASASGEPWQCALPDWRAIDLEYTRADNFVY